MFIESQMDRWFSPGQASLVLIGERFPRLNEQSASSNLTALAQPVSTTAQQQEQQQQQPANTTILQQQQPANTTILQQQQPVIGQTPLSQLQQLTATPTFPQYGTQQPTTQIPTTVQPLPAQSLMQSTPQAQLQNTPAQPYGIPSTSATIQPQLSALPPTATTFPPSVLPPVIRSSLMVRQEVWDILQRSLISMGPVQLVQLLLLSAHHLNKSRRGFLRYQHRIAVEHFCLRLKVCLVEMGIMIIR
ncbi:MAG: hypothetical protein ACM3X1_07865 [Ignavibacteriales bacterium]